MYLNFDDVLCTKKYLFQLFLLYFNMVQALDAQKNLNAKLAVCKMADLGEKY